MKEKLHSNIWTNSEYSNQILDLIQDCVQNVYDALQTYETFVQFTFGIETKRYNGVRQEEILYKICQSNSIK